VVERPRVGNRSLNTLIYHWILMLDENRDRAEPFRWISGTLGREGWGELCDYSEVFYVIAPACVG
jgi:hypothetical protein